MGSSAQNRSGVHWCRSRVRFNEVPEKVPKVPEKVWEALVHSGEGSGEGLGGFGVEPGQVQQPSGKGSGEGSRKPWEALVQSKVKFNRVPEKRRFRRRMGRPWCRAR